MFKEQILLLLVRKRRENLIETIARQMHELLDQDAGRTVAQITTPSPLAPDELAPATYGDLRLVDAETGGVQEVTFGKYRLRSYQQMVQNFCQKLREYCQARGVNFFLAGSDTSLEQLLLKQLRQAEVWG